MRAYIKTHILHPYGTLFFLLDEMPQIVYISLCIIINVYYMIYISVVSKAFERIAFLKKNIKCTKKDTK